MGYVDWYNNATPEERSEVVSGATRAVGVRQTEEEVEWLWCVLISDQQNNVVIHLWAGIIILQQLPPTPQPLKQDHVFRNGICMIIYWPYGA